MRTLIRIDRSTIRKNPNAGNTVSYIESPKEVTGILHGDLPDEYKDRLIITSSDFSSDSPPQHSFTATGDASDILEMMASDKRIEQLTISGGQEAFHHAPEPSYLFEYEDTPVQCQQCKAMVPVEDIQTDYESDEIGQLCPNCEGVNTFDYEHEKISDAIMTYRK